MSQPPVTRATPAARDRVVETVVTAFANDPAFGYFFPDRQTFVDHATTFARYLFDRRVQRGTIWIVDGGTSVAMWDEPGAGDDPGDDGPTLRLPAAALARLDAYHAAVENALPAERFWYLGILATHPDAKGRRWGRLVMTPALELAADAGLPAYLETTNPNNVRLYQGVGWEVTTSLRVTALPIWVLRWPARAAQMPRSQRGGGH
jgi:GNAT superfamily N-acetyltransferase